MSLSAHYVTQSSVYSSPLCGPLTDRRIAHYEELGYYGPEAKTKRAEERKQKAAKRRLTKEQVFARFNL